MWKRVRKKKSSRMTLARTTGTQNVKTDSTFWELTVRQIPKNLRNSPLEL